MKKMKIRLQILENIPNCNAEELGKKIRKNLVNDQDLNRLIAKTSGVLKWTIKGENRDISQLYSIITRAGYAIKESEIITRQDGMSTDNQRLANDYMETKVRFNPEKTKGKIVSKYNSKLTNTEVQK